MDKQWKLVPVTLTPAMVMAADDTGHGNLTNEGWAAALAAAPQPPSASDERFEAWWLAEGQFCRAGGGEYEKTFAYRAFQAALAPSPDVDAADQKILYTVKVSGAFQTFSRTVHSLRLPEGEYDLYAGAYREPHPPSRDCMCAACRPSFDNGADDPAQRYDITRGGSNG